MIWDFFTYAFLTRALIVGVVLACVAPLLGIFVVVRRQALVADTLAHASLAGVAIGILVFPRAPLFVAFVVAFAAALLIEQLRRRGNMPSDSALAIVLSGGLALALALFSWFKEGNAIVSNYLFGNITTVSTSETIMILAISAALIVTIGLLFERLFLLSFDETLARAQGLRADGLNALFSALTAALVTAGMRVVGVLLIGALLTLPVLAATQFRKSFSATTLIAVVIAVLGVVAGLFISYALNIATGATIVLALLALYLFALPFHSMKNR